jgi:hypothetical protein
MSSRQSPPAASSKTSASIFSVSVYPLARSRSLTCSAIPWSSPSARSISSTSGSPARPVTASAPAATSTP